MAEQRTGVGEPQARILVVDDERVALKNLLHVLRGEGYAVEGVQSGAAALKVIDQQELDLVLTDLRMEQVDGFAVLRHCRGRHPDTPVILITGHATVASAVEAMREGAFHYIEKPFRLDEVRHLVREALELTRLRRENRTLRERLANQGDPDRPLTQDPALTKLLDTARQIAPTGCNVIISGASGTGKELLARYLHHHGGRADGPFIAVNCGALSEELLVNELFGHERGAYTGANETRAGLVEAADGGTLFLDEVTEMSLGMQVKLLRVVQEGEVQRLGSSRPRRVDVRFIAATNRDLPEAVASGRFRQDLYYRLNVMGLRLPPLAERRGDIPLLAHYFLKRAATAMGKPVQEITPQAMALLAGYDFPGNVRELANLIERGVALATGTQLGPEQLPEDLRELRVYSYQWQPHSLPTLEAQEGDYIRWVLGQTGGNRTRAAEILGIDRVSLWRKLKKYGIET